MTIFTEVRTTFFIGEIDLRRLIITAPNRYKVHTILKRHNRGTRVIAQPKAEIKVLQKFVLNKHLSGLPVHQVAKAYVRGFGIKDHASPHAANRYLLKLDFSDFFNSILSQDFEKYLIKTNLFSVEDINLLVNLMFWLPKGTNQKRLSIGAPSSPHLSNLLMFEFDKALFDYCANYNITYTRYADDIALSTNTPKTLDATLEFVRQLCVNQESPKLQLNQEKTVFTSKKSSRSLTGLILANDGQPSLGRSRMRILRATAFNYSQGKLTEPEIATLRGHLAFAHSINPVFVAKLKAMIGENTYKNLMSF